jgi:hypothetical protein
LESDQPLEAFPNQSAHCPQIFIFQLAGIQFTIKTYICEKAGFQLLLGTHFWWSVGAALFPRLGKIIITPPALRVISATCEVFPQGQRPPPLSLQQPGNPPKATPIENVSIDPLSGEEVMEHPPPEFHYMDARQDDDVTSFLKITTHSDVITVGERDYIKDIDEDGDDRTNTDQNPGDRQRQQRRGDCQNLSRRRVGLKEIKDAMYS